MRILIVTTYFPPQNSIASLRPYSWAKAWSLAGHDVTVLTIAKSKAAITDLNLPLTGFSMRAVELPRWISWLKKRYQALQPSQQANDNIASTWKTDLKAFILTLCNYLRHKRGIFNTCRMPDLSDLWIRPALNSIKNEQPWDLVISTAGPYATHIVAAQIKKSQQALKWIADYRDGWSDSRIFPGVFPFNHFEKWLEKKLVSNADAITTISEPFAQAYKQRFPTLNVYTIENGFDPDDLANLQLESIFPADGKFRVVYSGSIYPGKQDPEPFFQAIANLQSNPLYAHLLTNLEVIFIGANQTHLEKILKNYDLGTCVKLAGFVNRESALRMQRDAHALLFLGWNDLSADGIMTGKLFEYLYSQTPILAIANHKNDTPQQLIVEANAGVVYTQPSEISAWLVSQLTNPVKCRLRIDPFILNRYNRHFLAMKLLTYASQKP